MTLLSKVVAGLLSLFIIWVIFLANTSPGHPILAAAGRIPYGDKWAHIALFGCLNFALILATRFRAWQIRKIGLNLGFSLGVYKVSLILFVLIVLEELSQIRIASRNFDLWDLLADLGGLLLSSLLARLWSWCFVKQGAATC